MFMQNFIKLSQVQGFMGYRVHIVFIEKKRSDDAEKQYCRRFRGE